MADYLDSPHRQALEHGSQAPGQVPGGRHSAGDLESGASPQLSHEEVESLKRKLALYQKKKDAVHQRVASIQREGQAAAEAVRREAEAKAQEIIQRATVEAELLELRARVRAEEMRAREVAQFWASMDLAEGDGETAEPSQSAPLAPDLHEWETIGGTSEPEEAGEAQTSTAAVEESRPDEEDLGTETRDVAAEGYRQGEEDAGGTEPGSSLALAEPSEGETVYVPSESTPVEERQYRLSVPLSPDAMVAMEEAVGRIAGVLSARVNLAPDGGAILTVSSHDSQRTELAIRPLCL